MAEVLWLRVGQEWAQEDIGDTRKEAQGWAGAWTRAGPMKRCQVRLSGCWKGEQEGALAWAGSPGRVQLSLLDMAGRGAC